MKRWPIIRHARYFWQQNRRIIELRMCIDAVQSYIEQGDTANARIWVERGEAITKHADDIWSGRA
jgi:hypothetical protein